MRAIVCVRYGEPDEALQLREMPKPSPAANQVLVKVIASSINVVDLAPVRGQLLARLFGTGLTKPKRAVLGTDLAGIVESVGAEVKRFRPGDEVFGASNASFAEYACAKEDNLVPKPKNSTFEQAATLPVAAITALQGLRWARIAPGKKVLVNGASGGVGTFAIQVAKSFGAMVTAVCSSKSVDSSHSLGADYVIDYTKEDFAKGEQRYDLILAVNGYHSMRSYLHALTPKGTCAIVGGAISQVIQSIVVGPLITRVSGKRIGFMGVAKFTQTDLLALKELLESEKIRPLIERRYPLAETAKALGYLEEGHALGKVVITMAEPPP